MNSLTVAGGDQLLFKGRVVNPIDLARLRPHKELVALTSACQGSDTALNLNGPGKKKQDLFLLKCT